MIPVPPEYIRTAADKLAISQGAYWDEDEAEKIVRFAETYFAPQFIKGTFRLLRWQADWLRQLYGWRLPSGQRRWRKALLTVSKKNGKSLLCSIVALYESLASGVPSPLCISCSTTKENARQIYDEVKNSINRHERLKKLAKLVPSQKIIRFKAKNAEFRSISNDSGNAEGLNLSCAIADEVHKWKGDALYRTIEYATIARESGVLVIISTAGSDQGHFFYDLVVKARNILKGEDKDTSFFATVYEAELDDDFTDPKVWRKANPSLGTSFTEEDFRRDLEAAKADTASLLSFRRYRLNTWVRADDSYLSADQFDQCAAPVDEATLKTAPLYVGLDLSQTTDCCSVSCVWALPDRKFYVRSHAWVCEAGVRKREQSNLPRYQQFAADGCLTITPGTCNDYRAIHRHILDLRQSYNLQQVAIDQYNAIEMSAELMAEGVNVGKHTQNHRWYNGPMKEFEIAVREHRIQHDGRQPLLRWSLQNTRLDIDRNGDVKPSRDKSTDKIDPTVSTLMAFGVALPANVTLQQEDSIYNTRPVFFC